MRKLVSCEFNIDTACVELRYADGEAQLGEGRVVGYQLVEVDAEKPAVCDVDAHFLFQAPLGVYAVHITEQQHFDNDNGVDRRV